MNRYILLFAIALVLFSCANHPCRVTYDVTDKYNPTIKVERIYLNDSEFVQKSTEVTSVNPFVDYDTFKIVKRNWYYLWNGKYKPYFSESGFLKKTPIRDYYRKQYSVADSSQFDYFRYDPDTVRKEKGHIIYVYRVFWMQPHIDGKGHYKIQKNGTLEFDPKKGQVRGEHIEDNDWQMVNYVAYKRCSKKAP
jgi:hypothetical protein